jgi:hypothetical protein
VGNDVLIALISACSSGLVALTALLLNYRGFSAIDSRFASLDKSLDNRFASIDHRLEMMQSDMKDLNKTMTALEIDLALLKDRADL